MMSILQMKGLNKRGEEASSLGQLLNGGTGLLCPHVVHVLCDACGWCWGAQGPGSPCLPKAQGMVSLTHFYVDATSQVMHVLIIQNDISEVPVQPRGISFYRKGSDCSCISHPFLYNPRITSLHKSVSANYLNCSVLSEDYWLTFLLMLCLGFLAYRKKLINSIRQFPFRPCYPFRRSSFQVLKDNFLFEGRNELHILLLCSFVMKKSLFCQLCLPLNHFDASVPWFDSET